MTIIRGPKGGHAQISGTSGNDLIAADGGYNTINGGGGDDSIAAGAGGHADVLIGSTGDGETGVFDTVSVAGAGNTLAAGDENVLLLGSARASTFTLGNGNNTVDIDGANNTISAGAGQNTVSALGGGAHVDFFAVDQASYGPDTVFVSGRHNAVTASFFNIPQAAPADVNVYGGSGNGTFVLPAYSAGTPGALAGSADNVVTGGLDNVIQSGGGLIVAGSGADTVSFYGEDTNVVLAGAGNSVSCVAGASTITGGSGAGSFTLSGQYVDGARGLITLQTYGQDNAISLFDGTFKVAAGSGQDTVSALIASGTIAFYGTGDRLVLSNGQDLTVQDHAIGLDIVVSQGDTGTLTIDHFGAGSVLDLNTSDGYASVGQILAALTETSAGTYSLATSDHGSVLFAGVGHLTADNFKIG